MKGIEVAVLDHEIFGDDHFLGGWRLFDSAGQLSW